MILAATQPPTTKEKKALQTAHMIPPKWTLSPAEDRFAMSYDLGSGGNPDQAHDETRTARAARAPTQTALQLTGHKADSPGVDGFRAIIIAHIHWNPLCEFLLRRARSQGHLQARLAMAVTTVFQNIRLKARIERRRKRFVRHPCLVKQIICSQVRMANEKAICVPISGN